MPSAGPRKRLPELDLVPRPARLPVCVTRDGPAVLGGLLLLVGVGLFALGVVLVLPLNRVSISVSPWLLSTGVLLFRSSIRQFRWSGTWHFTPYCVRRRRGLPFGACNWREPLSAYEAVVAEQRPRRNHPLGRPYAVYTIVLEHAACPERNVLLYCCLGHGVLRSRLQHYGRLFGKPILTRGRSTVRERPTEGSGSLRDRVSAGLLGPRLDPATRPTGRMRLALREHALSIVAPRGRVRRMASLVLLAGAITCWGFVGVRRLAPPNPSPVLRWPWLLPAWGTTLLLPVVWWFREELSVSPYRISKFWCIGVCVLSTQQMQAWTVDDVYVGESVTSPGAACVCIEGATGDITFGRTLSPAEREWVSQCTVTVITAPYGPRVANAAMSRHRAAGWAA
jgi:hypothetical protein